MGPRSVYVRAILALGWMMRERAEQLERIVTLADCVWALMEKLDPNIDGMSRKRPYLDGRRLSNGAFSVTISLELKLSPAYRSLYLR